MERWETVYWAGLTGVLSALATGLGAVPALLVRNRSQTIRAFVAAMAAGMMISASVFSLAHEGLALKATDPLAPYEVVLGLFLGAGFIALLASWLDPLVHPGRPQDSPLPERRRKGILIFLAMLIHSFPEGVAIGVGFGTGDFRVGLLLSLAIAIHNIPEGIAISLPMRSEGSSFLRCVAYSILSGVPQPIAAVPAALAVWLFQPLLPTGLGFAGGAMMLVVLTDLIPDAIEEGSKTLMAWGVMIGLGGMLVLTSLLDLLGR